METINAEILTLTYGSIVRQLISDYEDVDEVNKQLEKMGYNIGQRLIDEYLARSKTTSCSDFKEVAERIAHVGFRMFLNTSARVAAWAPDGRSCSLILEDNPLTDFVELPEQLRGLSYSNILCGVIRGALEMVNIDAECSFVRDSLRGDDATELRLTFVAAAPEAYPYKDDD
ncbi:BET3 [Auxenochlorella protothecoides x Auxenochlorella symbiontica]|uniref:Trafficking protein particle complex subunit n=1 Tax=Auxenochlorella protothecoides TaxID=3075 RepID=A0A087SQ72_AUXPR|nr:Trafficking protein particle complex subunit 3 [Auxenochlorella protothecoides]KFM27876.1 Trafficking protein particle complex subunit 3 [Auxenochlorella protothecoides]